MHKQTQSADQVRDKLNLDPNKPTILVCTDSAAIHTGLARVTRETFRGIHDLNKYNIVQHAWFHQDVTEHVPWPLMTTERTKDKQITLRDKFGQVTLTQQVLPRIKPDIVMAFHDPWNLSHFANIQVRNFSLVAYTCVDSEPMPLNSKDIFEKCDHLVLFGEWAKHVVLSDKRFAVDPNKVEVIPHGVDTKVFRKLTHDEINRCRKETMGIGPDDFVFGCVARNQPRKNLGRFVQFASHLVHGTYAYCKNCSHVNTFDINPITGKVRERPSACRYCRKSEHMIEAVAIPSAHFYYQGVANDASGWNLVELATQLGVADNFHYNPNIRPTAGYDDKSLNIIYNCMDVFTCPTTAEGFGLPIMEAMAAGVPTLLPNYSAYTDWVGESGVLVSGEKYIETSLNATRIQVHMDDWIDKALQMMDTTAYEGRPHREATFWMSLAARKIAESYAIEKTVQKFDALFTKILANKPVAPKVNLTRI